MVRLLERYCLFSRLLVRWRANKSTQLFCNASQDETCFPTLLDYRHSQCHFSYNILYFCSCPTFSIQNLSSNIISHGWNVLKASFYWRAPYLRSLDASCICNVVEACICKKAQAWKPQWSGWAQKVCNISKWIGRGRIAKVKKEKWIGTARLAQAKLRRKEKMLLLLFLCSQKPDPMEGWYGWNFEAQIVSTGFWMFYTLCTKDGPCHYPPHKIPSHRQVGW